MIWSNSLIVFGLYNYMAEFPNGVYAPRTKENKNGVVYDETKSKNIYAEDISKLDDEVVAIEEFLLDNPPVILTKKISLTSANIRALYSTPFELLPACGAGKFYQIISMQGKLNFITPAYNTSTNLYIKQNTTEGGSNESTLLASTSNRMAHMNNISTQDTDIENKSVLLYAKTSNPANGNGTLDIYISYCIRSL